MIFDGSCAQTRTSYIFGCGAPRASRRRRGGEGGEERGPQAGPAPKTSDKGVSLVVIVEIRTPHARAGTSRSTRTAYSCDEPSVELWSIASSYEERKSRGRPEPRKSETSIASDASSDDAAPASSSRNCGAETTVRDAFEPRESTTTTWTCGAVADGAVAAERDATIVGKGGEWKGEEQKTRRGGGGKANARRKSRRLRD